MPDLLYRLNAHDQISSVSEEWLSFADANEGESLLPPAVLGRPLWDFIADHDTRHIYEALHRRVRTLAVPVRLSFRCDGPERRRLLQLDIVAEEDRDLVYRVRTLKQQARPLMPLLDPRQSRSDGFVTVCGWCKRISVPPRRWLEVEEAVEALRLFAEALPPQITHGICVECSEGLHQALDGANDNPVLGGW